MTTLAPVHGFEAVAQTAPVEPFKGKTVKLVVGYGAGGGYDSYARMIAPHLAKALGATVIVENLPGAGGIVALNRTAMSAPDGLTIQIVNGTGAVMSQLVEVSAVRYDLLTLTHLGTVSISPWMWMVGPGSPFKRPADVTMTKQRLSWAASGSIDGLGDGAAFTCEALRLNCRVVIGYKGSTDAAFAVVRGETDAIYLSDTSANSMAKSGGARALATMGRIRSRYFPEAPLIFDAVELDKASAWLMDFRSSAEDLGRILVGPPRIPAYRAELLRIALKATLTSPAVVAEGEKTQRYVNYLDSAATMANVRKVLNDPTPAQKKRVKEVINKAQ